MGADRFEVNAGARIVHLIVARRGSYYEKSLSVSPPQVRHAFTSVEGQKLKRETSDECAVSEAKQSRDSLCRIASASNSSGVSAQLRSRISFEHKTFESSSCSFFHARYRCYDLPQRCRANRTKPKRNHSDARQPQLFQLWQTVRYPGRWQSRR